MATPKTRAAARRVSATRRSDAVDLRVRDLWLTERADRAMKNQDDADDYAAQMLGASHPAQMRSWQEVPFR